MKLGKDFEAVELAKAFKDAMQLSRTY